MAYERRNKAKPVAAFLVLFFMVIVMPAQAEVYKWVDEGGHAHYGEKPPKQGEHTQLRTQAAPVIPQEESTSAGPDLSPKQREIERKQELATKQFQDAQRARDHAAQEEARAGQKRYEDGMAAKNAQDEELIAECNRNRETYCDKGLDKIKTEQEYRSIEEEEERKRRNSVRGRY